MVLRPPTYEHHNQRIVRLDCLIEIDAPPQLVERVVLVTGESDELEYGEHLWWCQGDRQVEGTRTGQQATVELVPRHRTRPFRAIRVDVLAVSGG